MGEKLSKKLVDMQLDYICIKLKISGNVFNQIISAC